MTLSFLWWGHSSATVGLGRTRVALDPMFHRRLFHLRRHGPTPEPACCDVEVALVSHLHADHLHLPSLARLPAEVPLVVPEGAGPLLARLPHPVLEVSPGTTVRVAGVEVEVLAAFHDGRRLPGSRLHGPALGFRVTGVEPAGGSFWYPGDTGLTQEMYDVAPVDLAVVPVGGWGPSLGEEHLDPDEAAEAVGRVGARWAVPVHYGTLWPIGMELAHSTRHRLFETPGRRFAEAMAATHPAVRVDVPAHGEEVSR